MEFIFLYIAACASRAAPPVPALGVPRLVEVESLFPSSPDDRLAPTTSRLPRRSELETPRHDSVSLLPGALGLTTCCEGASCVDVLTDRLSGRELVGPEGLAEAQSDLGYWLERRVLVTYADDRLVSAFVASSSFTGGAHAVNDLICKTWTRQDGHSVSALDVVPGLSAVTLRDRLVPLRDELRAPTVAPDDAFWAHPPILWVDDGPSLCLPTDYPNAGSLWLVPLTVAAPPAAERQ